MKTRRGQKGRGWKLKIFISADIEGTTGIVHFDEATKNKPDYAEFQKQMTAEVGAVCEGAIEAGADEIYIKDAHDSGRNIIAADLPERVKMIREWSGHPFSMVFGLDRSFDAAIFTGYHSRAGSDSNPLAHTFTGSIYRVKINERYASEFLINAYAAASVGVPVVLVTGDKGLCDEVKEVNPGIATVAVNEGIGSASISIHPALAVRRIREEADRILSGDLAKCKFKLPSKFDIAIEFKDYKKAYRLSFYPGARLENKLTVRYECVDYFDFLRLFAFM